MSILNFRKQRQYTKNKSGQYDLVSNWTSAETVYDRDGHCVMERLDNALLPMVDGTDNGKLLTVKNGGWTKTSSLTFDENDNKLTIGGVSTLITDAMIVKKSDILLNGGTWDGTNTSLTTAVNSAKGTVTQTATDSTDEDYEVLFSGTEDNTTRTEGARKTQYLKYNPNNKNLTVGDVSGKKYIKIAPHIVALQGYEDTNITPFIMIKPKDIVLGGKTGTTSSFSFNTWDGKHTSLKTTITNLRPIVVKKTVTSDSNLRVHCSIDPSDIDSSWTDFTHVTLCSLSLMNKANNKTYYALGDSNHSNPYFEYQQSSMDLSYDVLSLGGSAGQEYLFTFVFLPIDNARVISLDT